MIALYCYLFFHFMFGAGICHYYVNKDIRSGCFDWAGDIFACVFHLICWPWVIGFELARVLGDNGKIK